MASVASFYDTHNPAMVSRDGRSTYVRRPTSSLCRTQRLKDDAQQIEGSFAGQADVKLGGQAMANAQANTQVSHDLAHAELLAFPFIFLLSLLFFRSLVAALLPPLLGGLAIVATFFALRIVVELRRPLGVRAQPRHGAGARAGDRLQPVHGLALPRGGRRLRLRAAALRRTLQTSGRTIMFSSLTVAAAIASLAIFPQRFLYSMGIAGALVALLAAALALIVLPALLAVLGPRVNALAPRRLQRAADRDARPAESGFWYRLSRFVMRRPGRIAVVSATFLIALGIPFTGIKFITVSANVLPTSASARQVDDVLRHAVPAQPHGAARSRRRRAGDARRRSTRWPRGSSRLPGVSAVSPGAAGWPPHVAARRRAPHSRR